MVEAKNAEMLRIGRLIASLRRRAGLSQEKLAQEIDVSTSSVHRWENGINQPYGANLRKLAALFEVDVVLLVPADDLLLGSQFDHMQAQIDRIAEAIGLGASPGEDFERAINGESQPPARVPKPPAGDAPAKPNSAAG